jgi:hypothetical protein
MFPGNSTLNLASRWEWGKHPMPDGPQPDKKGKFGGNRGAAGALDGRNSFKQTALYGI